MSKETHSPGDANATGFWLDDASHRAWLDAQAHSLWSFFAASKQDEPGFGLLDHSGDPLPAGQQELHTTTRMVHSYALAKKNGVPGALEMVDHGMAYLLQAHRDKEFGGYGWAVDEDGQLLGPKLAYGHVFVLLAAASAKSVAHPEADGLMDDIVDVLDRHFWDDDAGRFCDEFNRDWSPFSTYRGMNANMHGVEALLAAYEATGRDRFLDQAGRILAFFTGQMAPAHHWRLPEHYTEDWQVDPDYAGDHMFRPAGTTPGHSFELGRLLLQYWDLRGRPATDAPQNARALIEQALTDAWLPDGGFAYTLKFDGAIADSSRFWWPVTEAIGAVAALIHLDRRPEDELWYRRLWQFAAEHFIDHEYGGWFPAIDTAGRPTSSIFSGKPDIYHAVQACVFPLAGRLSRAF